MKLKIEKVSIDKNTSILETLKRMDKEDKKLLLVTQNGHYHGLISIGDIQRAIIADLDLKKPISEAMRSQIRVARQEDDPENIRDRMMKFRTEFMPILNDQDELADILFWHDVYAETCPPKKQINLPVVIMAGGRGTRMQPLTNVFPKPLIPLGNKTILERIMDSFVRGGSHHFILSVNYKADTIRHYLSELNSPEYEIDYIQETEPLGTAGSLQLLKGRMTDTFWVSNCDILIDQDLSEIYEFHKKFNNQISIVAAVKHLTIPYGTLETRSDGQLSQLQEKPDFVFKINTGVYLLEPQAIDEIPEDVIFHITDLIEKVRKKEGRVGVFPIPDYAWSDVGSWEEYQKTSTKLKFGSMLIS
ncbi:nucleotidyltransferase family protein [Desulfotignum balticum]|uniref:nucleotidyltransferase family protein n=1 Tax=Desulfotignum balticum TaxID=115781 RepID=UPI000462B93D|nr:nucleotidyltransferase family protein [Desulfotignum balticum]